MKLRLPSIHIPSIRISTILIGIIVAIGVLIPFGCRKETRYRIGVSQCNDDDWRRKMNEEIEREMLFHPEAEVEIRSAEDSNEKQIDDLRYFAKEGFDIVIAAPREAAPLTPVVDELMEKGIPVVIFDRSVEGDRYTAFQGADNAGLGMAAAQYVNHLTGGKAGIIEIEGLSGSTPARDRRRGFSEGLKVSEGLKILGSGKGNWLESEASRVADSLLTLYPETDVIYAHNDRMAIAAGEVARQHKLHPYIIGIDAAPEIGVEGVVEGKIDATFLYPTEGARLVRTALSILKGEPYERKTILPALSAVDRTNADILLKQNEMLQDGTQQLLDLEEQLEVYWLRHSLQTTLFYAVVAILVLLFVVMFMLLRAYWQRKKHQEELEKRAKELEEQRDQLEELNEQLEAATKSKLLFFTNVSHDLRTPLSLIKEPVDQLEGSAHLDEKERGLLQIARKNVRILHRLINQILEFRRYENGKVDLELSEVRFDEIAREWGDAFRVMAGKRGMRYTVGPGSRSGDAPATLAIDVEKIERVVFNLISNAFKYTPDGGEIHYDWLITADRLEISVRDNGRGITAEDLENVFERFFRVEKVHATGSGIGLSVAKAFIELHGGSITAESEPGRGSEFKVSLPVRHTAGDATPLPAATSGITAEEVEAELGVVESPEPTEGDLPLLLVIDDNPDIRAMVGALLGEDYRIITASDGRKGLRMAVKYTPDLVMCDVMMPDMNGLECCRAIKEEVSTSHIPVLLVTACAMDEQRAEGYEAGADGYISKPFSTEVLRSRCRSLIANRKRIMSSGEHQGIGKLHSASEGDEDVKERRTLPKGDIDNDFYLRFVEIMEKEIGNADLSVDELAGRLGLGRSQFYRKIKSLTNFSPVELMKQIRLKHARRLLTTTDKTISEIAYESGFSNPAYFTKCFREFFSETPSEIRERL